MLLQRLAQQPVQRKQPLLAPKRQELAPVPPWVRVRERVLPLFCRKQPKQRQQ
jgi:hypothetical protein